MLATLVVGGTGILQPAVHTLAQRGLPVAALARSAADLQALVAQYPGRVSAIRADYTDYAEAGLLCGLRFAQAICYCPGAQAEFLGSVRTATAGPVVQLLVSAVAAPQPEAETATFDVDQLPPAPAANWTRLVLGWTTSASPAPRPSEAIWHTPEQISAAAIDTLGLGRDAVLGLLRPWSARPA